MTAWHRWQDWVNVVLGVILFITPFVFGATATSSAAYTAWVIGVLLFLVGLYLLSSPQNVNVEWVQIVLGVLLFISPWVLGFTNLTQMAWSAWIIGVLAVIAAGWVLLTERGEVVQR